MSFFCLQAGLMSHSSALAQWIVPEFLKVELNRPVNIDKDWGTELIKAFSESRTELLKQSQERERESSALEETLSFLLSTGA